MRDVTLGLLFGVWLGIAANFPYADVFFPTQPYTDVSIHSYEKQEDGKHILNATFLKNGCEFQAIEGHGMIFNRWDHLDMVDVEGEEGDRVAGWHTINMEIDTSAATYDIVEVRTRHHCFDGEGNIEVVDRVFFRSENN